ncbi:MAG: type II toxin-antitoxin system HicA family toxin [Pseudomonadota bacterium]
MHSKILIRRLQADGWTLRASKGSHHIFVHPHKPGHISVPHPKKDLGKGISSQIMKQAGIINLQERSR